MVTRHGLPALRVSLEQREIGDPEEAVARLDGIQRSPKMPPQGVERRVGLIVRARAQHEQIAGFSG